ncbi:unnamed protein product [Somion occarium]|uniref:TPR-like protein n=1 Tax=Somion occarium TaxID=3059160 RepID=A0ABP1E8E4_9APHY
MRYFINNNTRDEHHAEEEYYSDLDDPPSEDEDEDEDDTTSSSEESGEEMEHDREETAEVQSQNDADFDRLVAQIRRGDGGTSAGMLTKEWDFSMQDKEAEFRDDLRQASGVGKRKGKGRGRGKRRTGPVLSQQVRALIGEGNQAYIDSDIPETIRIMQEVIRIEPRAASAWSVLAQCYDSHNLNEPHRALQLRIMSAHLNQDPDEWDQLALESKRIGYHQQALYCYRKLYNLEPSNTNALWDRAALAKEIGDFRIARHSLLAILKQLPHDLTVLDELRPVLIETNELELCANLFQSAFEHYQATFPSGSATNEAGADVPGGGFGLMEVLVLADLYNSSGEYVMAIVTIKQGCRWLQGRSKQTFWDKVDDDREYDVADMKIDRVTEGELGAGMYPLDVNARHRLAIARIKMGDIPEGKIHAKIILSQNVGEYAPLFAEIADAYFDREMYAEAGQIYEILGADTETSSLYVLMQAAACRRMVGDLKESAEVYEHVIVADPTHNDAKMKLAEIYEILGEPRKALDLVMQVIDSRRRRPGREKEGTPQGDITSTSLFEEKAIAKRKGVVAKTQRLNITQLRELETQKEQEVKQGYHRVKELWPQMLAGEEEAVREWLMEAEKLVETYRETRNLFLTSKHPGFRGMFPRSRKRITEATENDMASRLQLELGRDTIARKSKSDGSGSGDLDSFRTVKFDDWLRLFMQYAFVLTKQGNFDQAYEVLRHVAYSNPFQKQDIQDTIRLAIISCSLVGDQPFKVVEYSRKLINVHQFNNEPYRIMLASLGSGLRATDGFLVSTLSKHMLRELRTHAAALKNSDTLRWNPVSKRYAPVGTSVKDEEEDLEAPAPEAGSSNTHLSSGQTKLPTKDNPILVAMYGQICLAARSYQSALFYLLHAYDYCQEDPLICLCLAVASIGRAMQRQADNRHHLITQGMAFLTKYRNLRGGLADEMDEIEYNFGRTFHQLGLYTLAVKHYERVLHVIEERLRVNDQADYGVALEAAYNLSLIYVMTGATPLAQDLYRRWLSL